MIVYKKAFFWNRKNKVPCIVTLDIPDDALVVFSEDGQSGRCNKAKVVDITLVNTYGSYDDLVDILITKAISFYEPSFCYKLGKVVYANDFDYATCGIYFHKTYDQAVSFKW